MIYLLILCFMPALLVWGFVTVFKEKLAKNPTKKEYFTMVAQYVGVIATISFVAFAFARIF